jgi:hypothetical protein
MKNLLIPALGVAAAIGAAQPAAADVQLSQLMIQGQPGYSGNVNRTLPSGSAGITPLNTPVGPSPYTVAPSPSFTQPSPFIGQRGELNAAEREYAAPGEPDASGKIAPTVDRARARFAGERGSDGKLLPTYDAGQRAQASQPSQASPPTPAPSDMQRSQPTPLQPGATQRRPGSGEMTGQSGTGAAQRSQATTQQQRPQSQMQSGQRSGSTQSRAGARGQEEMGTTAALNALAAEGYTNVGKIERVGNAWQTTAMKQGKQVTVQIDPQTHRVMER